MNKLSIYQTSNELIFNTEMTAKMTFSKIYKQPKFTPVHLVLVDKQEN